MGKRKSTAPQANLGRFEDRNLLASPPQQDVGGALSVEGGWLEEEQPDDWADLGGLEGDNDSSDVVARKPAKRRRCQQQHRRRQRREADSGADDLLAVAVQLVLPEEQQWQFAELEVGWQESASSSRHQQHQQIEEGELLLTAQPPCSNMPSGSQSPAGGSGGSFTVVLQCHAASSGSLWQGRLDVPSQVEAEALLLLLKSGHLSCGVLPASVTGQSTTHTDRGSGKANGSSTPGNLCLSLTEKAAANAAEDPEERQQRHWHRQLLALLFWVLPELDPERELQLASPVKQAELLNSPLCSPRGAAAAAGEGASCFGTASAAAAGQGLPCSPRSPKNGSAAGAGAAAPTFDAAELYAAVKPTGREPELPASATSAFLLPTLRRYQARAAQWMVAREQGTASTAAHATAALGALAGSAGVDAGGKRLGERQQGRPEDMPLHPLWRCVPCLGNGADIAPHGSSGPNSGTRTCFYVNPFNGRISLERFQAPSEVAGGMLADEMGLGKTVELLACIVAHRYTGPPPSFPLQQQQQQARQRGGKRRGEPVVACLCGATSEAGYEGLWVQCDECDTWLHAACCGLRRAPPGEFVCGACQRAAAAASVTQDCGATLVVCPTPILHQWRDEILRHIKPGALKVLVYEGQPQPGAGRSSKVVTAAELASADIVLTTYDVLRRDVHHICPDDEEGHSLRRRKKYEVMPTPLTRLRWWRVCLDEAQMVESSTAKAAEMALKLQTVHRWCVTGTPLSRGLEDLFGLLAFLQAAPYDNRHWWHRAVQHPYEAGSRAARARLLALLRPSLGGLLWRSSKADVAHELGLPPQHHHLARLQMSAIEKHFYIRAHQDCVAKARSALSPQMLAAATKAAAALDGVMVVEPASPGSPALRSCAATAAAAAGFEDRALTRKEEASLLHPLLRLRQACCHPQVGGGGIRAGIAGQGARAPMTMGEVLEVMLAKARVEAEDAQRLLLASLNGLAGLLLLQQQPAEAVRAYREALATVEQNSAMIRADKLQQLHTLTNLASLLGADGRAEGVAPTLRDARLEQEAQEIREEYLAESAARLAVANAELEEVRQHMQRCRAPLLQQVSPSEAEELLAGWYMRAVALITAHGSQRAVADRIKEQVKEDSTYLRSVSQNATTIASRFRDLYGLELAVKQEVQELRRAQTAATEELSRLQAACEQPPPSLVELAATCSRCRAETAVEGRVCRHCKLEELFWQWEGRAFALYTKARDGAGHVTAEEAIRQAHQAALFNRVGRGGLGEAAVEKLGNGAGGTAGTDGAGGVEAGEEDGGNYLLLGAGRRDDAVAKTEIVRRPGDSENVLRLLLHQLRLLRVPPDVTAEKELILIAGRVHLELMEQFRREYIKARALSLAQRQRLYAYDELEQCTMRIKLLSDNDLRRTEGEEIYRIYEHEVPVRSTELSNDKAGAELELRRKLGTLRYLTSIKAREAARSAAAAAAAGATAAGETGAVGDPLAAAGEPPTAAGEGTDPAITADGEIAEARAGDGAAGCGAAAGGVKPEAAGGDVARIPAGASGGIEEDREDICPICHDHLGQELVMLSCAHRLCCRCSMTLQERMPAGQPQASRRIECPVCRTRVPVSEIVYVDARLASPGGKGLGGKQGEGEEDIEIKGSYGTKLEAVVSRLLWLSRRDPNNRMLVFSTWKDVLDLISHALTTNGLPHLYPRSSKKFEAAVAEFRSSHDAAVAAAAVPGSSKAAAAASAPAAAGSRRGQPPRVLLLLVKQGANGLNLTEAQHVVLVEPLLDPAVQAQAVGRVDRIGQLKPTHVHRFVVERTIEENVHRLCQQRAAAMDLSAASVKRVGGSKEACALTVRDVAQLLRQPDENMEEAEELDEIEQNDPVGDRDGSSGGREPVLSPRQRAAAAAVARAAATAAAAAPG